MKVSNKKKNKRLALAVRKPHYCPNCGEDVSITGGHFAPPCFGEKGFFVCQVNNDQPNKVYQRRI